MTRIFFIILTFVNINVSAQLMSDTIYYNANKKQTTADSANYVRVILADTNSGFQFLVQEFYMNDQLKMSGIFATINPDKKNGEFSFYYQNGTLKQKCTYANNKLQGTYQEWYLNGQLWKKREYLDNKLNGITRTWSEDGILQKKVEYKKGRKNGKFITYYNDGNPIREDIYRDDIFVEGQCYSAAGNDTTWFEHITAPTFLDGSASKFAQWILENIDYPEQALEKYQRVRAQIKFKVAVDGSVEGIHISGISNDTILKEIHRVIDLSPKWKPGKRDITNIPIQIVVPVVFNKKESE